MRAPLAFCLAGGAAALLLAALPGIDLWFSGLFYRPGSGFFLADWLPVRLLFRSAPYIAAAFVLFAIAAGARHYFGRRTLLGCDARAALYLVLALAIGPGLLVNTILKDHWGRARPSQIVEFGGDKQFTAALVPSHQCDRNCSFSSGHAALGFSLVAFAFLVTERRRRRLAVAAAVAAGGLLGLARIAQGGHFLSDVVLSGLLVTATSWLLHRAIMVVEWPTAPGKRLALWTVATAVAVLLSVPFLDRPVALFFHAQSDQLHAVFRFITQFGVSTGYLIGAAVSFVALRIAARMKRFAAVAERLEAYSALPLFFFTSVAASGLAVDLIKTIFGRARPKLLFSNGDYYFGWLGTRSDFWSFPSGHTANAVSVALVLSMIWPRYRALAAVFAALVAASRIIITAHYVSDVVMGAFLAFAIVPYLRFIFAQSGIDLDAARSATPQPRRAVRWRTRLGLDRRAPRSDTP
ncbi:MAG TPA: phosphatase PAP2 family protein [Stellaceae bacterium]|nr:phosphatase PAP2 family protein [Stellaceae bacterium]